MATTFEQSKEHSKALLPTSDEAEMARDSSRKLAGLFRNLQLKNQADEHQSAGAVEIKICLDGEFEIVSLPKSVLQLMEEVLSQTAQGHGVSIVPQQCELTTRQAAYHLGVSRPYLISLLEQGVIPYHRVGTHRRILFEDIHEYKKAMRQNSRKALNALAADGQEMGI